jgi:hypothetical protein
MVVYQCISMAVYICFSLSKALLLKNRIFEIKPSDYSLVRPRKSNQTTLCLRKIFHNVIFVVLGEDFST